MSDGPFKPNAGASSRMGLRHLERVIVLHVDITAQPLLQEVQQVKIPDGHHSHNHADPDLKIFAIAIMGIAGIVIGPALAAAMWVFALTLGLVLGFGVLALCGVIAYNLKQRPNLLPPAGPPRMMGGHNRLQRCTVNRRHRAIECNGYHLEISDT